MSRLLGIGMLGVHWVLVLAACGGSVPAAGTDGDPGGAGLRVVNVAFDTARLGANPVRATVRNCGDTAVLTVLDVRAEPGLWMIPNMQAQFGRVLAPGEEAVLEGTYEFRRMSREATLRVTVGPGETFTSGAYTGQRVVAIAFRRTYDVGRSSPDAFDPDTAFTKLERGPLVLYAWTGSAAEEALEGIAGERLDALRAIEALLAVAAPDTVRLVFYADERTKAEHTGHRGVGWAFGTTLVEVRNDSVRLDPYHEMTHIVAAAAGSPPPVLSEGLAIYASERLGADALEFLGHPDRSAHGVTCQARETGRFISLAELLALENIGSEEGGAGVEYAAAGSFVRYLIESRGLDAFRSAYRTLEDDADAVENAARLTRIYGQPLELLQAAWLAAAVAACGP